MHRENGFTLPEVLIAAAIAAGLISATLVSISATMRSSARSMEMETSTRDARNIAALLKSGRDVASIRARYPEWRFERSIAAESRSRATNAVDLVVWRATSEKRDDFYFSVARLEATLDE